MPDDGDSTSKPDAGSDESEGGEDEVILGGGNPDHDDGSLDDTTIIAEAIDSTQSPVNAGDEIPKVDEAGDAKCRG